MDCGQSLTTSVQVGSAPVPEPGEGEVQVALAYAGANFYDILMVQGKYQVTLPVSIRCHALH